VTNFLRQRLNGKSQVLGEGRDRLWCFKQSVRFLLHKGAVQRVCPEKNQADTQKVLHQSLSQRLTTPPTLKFWGLTYGKIKIGHHRTSGLLAVATQFLLCYRRWQIVHNGKNRQVLWIDRSSVQNSPPPVIINTCRSKASMAPLPIRSRLVIVVVCSLKFNRIRLGNIFKRRVRQTQFSEIHIDCLAVMSHSILELLIRITVEELLWRGVMMIIGVRFLLATNKPRSTFPRLPQDNPQN